MSKKIHSLVSLVLTVFVVSLLFLSGPAAAVTVSLQADSVTKGTNIPFTVTVDINDPDSYVPVQSAKIHITNSNGETCSVKSDGTSTCDNELTFSIQADDIEFSVSVDDSLGYGEGLGYGYDSTTGFGYDFGTNYGYGYSGAYGSITYTLNLDTNGLDVGDYTAKAEIYTEGNGISHVYSSDEVSFSVNAPSTSGGSPSGGGGSPTGGAVDQIVISTTPETLVLNENTNVVFSLNNEAHSVKLNSISDDHITVTVSSEPFNVDLPLNEEVTVDSNGNGKDDLFMKLDAIFASSARVTFKVLREAAESVIPETTEEGVTDETAGSEVTGAVVGGGSGWSKALIVVAVLAVIITIGYLAFTGKGGRLARKLKRRGQFIFFFYF